MVMVVMRFRLRIRRMPLPMRIVRHLVMNFWCGPASRRSGPHFLFRLRIKEWIGVQRDRPRPPRFITRGKWRRSFVRLDSSTTHPAELVGNAILIAAGGAQNHRYFTGEIVAHILRSIFRSLFRIGFRGQTLRCLHRRRHLIRTRLGPPHFGMSLRFLVVVHGWPSVVVRAHSSPEAGITARKTRSCLRSRWARRCKLRDDISTCARFGSRGDHRRGRHSPESAGCARGRQCR